MRGALWVVFLAICNILGVQAFTAAFTLPFEEALLPGILSVPLIGLTALSVTRVVACWRRPDE